MFSSRVFSPDTISGLTGWWDASDSSTLFNATTGGSLVSADGAVARLEDKSGNGRHFTQASSEQRPARKTAIQNNRDILRFPGTTKMNNTATYSDVMSSTQSTVFIVASATSVSSNSDVPQTNAILFSSEASASVGFLGVRSNGTAYSFGYDSAYRTASLSYDAGAWALFTTKHGSSVLSIRLNGGSESTVSLGTRAFFFGTIALAVSQGSTLFFEGDVGEIITYNVALSDLDRNLVESYLITKWGL
jgi:hypothetical protein